MREALIAPLPQPTDRLGPDLSEVFHRLNNQLGIILANAELLEARLAEQSHRARAGQVVSGALEAITAVQELRGLITPGPASRPEADSPPGPSIK